MIFLYANDIIDIFCRKLITDNCYSQLLCSTEVAFIIQNLM